jgi:hypothetical protein
MPPPQEQGLYLKQHVYVGRLSAKVPALYFMLYDLRGDIGNIEQHIRQAAIDSDSTGNPHRPCIISPTPTKHPSLLHVEGIAQETVFLFSTFDGTPFNELPSIYQATAVPLNGECPHAQNPAVYTQPRWKYGPRQEYVIGIPFQTDVTSFSDNPAVVKREMHARMTRENMKSLIASADKSLKQMKREAAAEPPGHARLRHFKEWQVPINVVYVSEHTMLTYCLLGLGQPCKTSGSVAFVHG